MARLGKRRRERLATHTTEILRDIHLIGLNREVISGSVNIGNVDKRWGLEVSFKIRVLQNLAENELNERGVFGVEKAYIYFPLNYPNGVPRFFLRADFPRDLPHLNPFLGPNNFASPCFYYGDNANLLSQPDGFMGMLDRFHEWLYDAALGNLIKGLTQITILYVV